MILFNRILQQASFLFLLAFIFFSSGCSTIVEKKAKEFDPSKVNNMLFIFDNHSNVLSSSLPNMDISTQVANNLAEWGYKIKADKSENHTHILSFEMREITRASTPAGFSFDIGNSNPRSIDFQKADVLPMTCFLAAKDQSERSAELDATVIADDYLPYIGKSGSHPKLVSILVNDISTICFNLLSNLKINTLPYEKNLYSTKPGWFPDIRVEIVNDADPDVNPENTAQPAIENNQKSNASRPATENNQKPNISRKRMIIHNQGTPIILKFGHERK